MRIHSYNRLDSIYAMLCDVSYRANYHGIRDAEVNPGTLETLDRMREQYPQYHAVYTRLLKEDAALANQGVRNVGLIGEMGSANEGAWLNTLHIVPQGSPEFTAARNRAVEDGRTMIFESVEDMIEALPMAFPGFEFQPRTSRAGTSYGTFQYRLDLAQVPEESRRYVESSPYATWQALEFGPIYPAGRYPRYSAMAIGIGGNGHLYDLDPNREVVFIGSTIMPARSASALIDRAREQYRENIIRRMRANRTGADVEAQREAERREKRAASAVRFQQFRAKMEAAKVSEMLIPTLPFVEPNKGIKSSRRWGIEIETGAGRDLSGIPSQWEAKGDGSLESSYGGNRYVDPDDCDYADDHQEEIEVRRNDTGATIWVDNPDYVDPYECDYCGDVYSDDYEDDDCVEVVSPILNSMHSRGLRQLCEDLESTPRNDSAGIHVHVEAKDLTVRQIKELVMGYDHIEHFIESSYDRTERGYCKRRSATELLEVVRQPDNGNPREMRTGDRYVTVNLQALYSHGTIEFRAMGPRYNYEHLVRWAMFCREMLNVIAAGATSKDFARAKSWSDVLAIFAKYGTEYNFATVGHMEDTNEFENIEVTV